MGGAPVEQFTDPLAYHGEGPVWTAEWGGPRFVDMLAGDIVSVDTHGELVGRLHVGEVAAAFRPRTGGGLVVAVERGFALMDADGTLRRFDPLWSDRRVRMNEGGCDPQGRFYCGSMHDDALAGRGNLYRLDVDGAVTRVLSGVTISNGLAWSGDGGRAYYVDTPTRRIDVFDHDPEAGLTGRRPFVTVPEGPGRPDGLTVDAEDHVWVAMYGGSAVHRYRPDGTLDGVVELPVSRVTACTFGGPDLGDLFITTSREKLPDGAEPEAGALFRARPGVTGRPALPFCG